jgi:hypothetical protein
VTTIIVRINFLILFSILIFISPVNSRAENGSKIQSAVDVVKNLCLSGTEYGLSADAEGNITIKNFKPKGSGALTVNVRESRGAIALQKELRIIGDREIRECTQKHIGRILDAIFETTPANSKNTSSRYRSVKSAKFLGYIPDQIEVVGFVEGKDALYYRFTVKEATEVKVHFIENSQMLRMELITAKENIIAKFGWIKNDLDLRSQFLTNGDYYIKLMCHNKNEATAFRMKILGEY